MTAIPESTLTSQTAGATFAPCTPTDDTLRFKVQATTVEPRSDVQLVVPITLMVRATDTDQAALESTVNEALQRLVATDWVFSSLRREGESLGFERVNLEALARVPVKEVHNLKQRARQASRDGMELGTPSVNYRMPESRINAIQAELRLKILQEVKLQQAVLAHATGRDWRIGAIDFGTRKGESDDGEVRFSKGGYRANAEEPFEGGGMAGADRFSLLAEVTLRSRFSEDSAQT